MLIAQAPNARGVVKLRVSGTLRANDYERELPKLDRWHSEHEELRYYVELDPDFAGFEARALFKELRFDWQHRGDVGRSVLVGDGRGQDWAARFAELLFAGEVRHFPRDEAEQAWEWVNG